MDNVKHLKRISLDGGVMCLDFINTVSDYTTKSPINYITGEQEWLTWLKRVNLIENDFSEFEAGSFSLHLILEVRETLYKLFSNYTIDKTLSKKVLSKFNKYCKRVNKHLRLITNGEEVVEILDYRRESADDYLMLIIRSAKDLLTSKQLRNVKGCPNCGWIFLDKTKSGTRRWCNMKACGNKIKTQKYYRKTSIQR